MFFLIDLEISLLSIKLIDHHLIFVKELKLILRKDGEKFIGKWLRNLIWINLFNILLKELLMWTKKILKKL